MSRHRVVIIEDDPQLRRYLRAMLSDTDYDVFAAETGARGLVEAAARRPDVVLLDLGLPDMDGIEIIRRVRSWSLVPIVVLSARSDQHGKVAALDAGADDYLVKPFGNDELLARLRVALRHANRSIGSESVYELNGLRIDMSAHTVRVDGQDVHLTVTEFKLLAELARAAGKVLTHRQLLTAVWGPTHSEDTQYLRLYMAQLRAKLERDATDPQLLLTEMGVGYRMAAADVS